ncbi:MAG: glycosyltransferase family 2 protein, partial [Patescibacteria group bacterium]|nr:glycosyltransferase family 2 protein [Patescibacteria group bacterium]
MNHRDINKPELTIILPCLNEEKAIGFCLDEIKKVIDKNNIAAEILVVDNGSTDRSCHIVQTMAKQLPKLKLIHESQPGYGNACRRGLTEAKGNYIYLSDADGSYNFSDIPLFLEKLRKGTDLIVGNRFQGGIENGSMPWHHRYVGNPVLSAFVKIFFKVKIGDIHCGARAISHSALTKLQLHADGMEFASEMIMKSARQGLSMVEIPIHYQPRIGDSKLRSVRDGWRHLRFILLYSPLYLFFIPGATLFIIGTIVLSTLYLTSPTVFGVQLFVHPMFLASAMIILGYELVFFAFFAKIYAMTHLGEANYFVERLFKIITIEKAGFLGLFLCFVGIAIYSVIAANWIHSGFGSLDQFKNSIVALTLFIIGAQTFFS